MQVRYIDPPDWVAMATRFRDLTFEQTAEYAVPAAMRIGGQARFVAVEERGQLIAGAALRVRKLPGLRRGIVWCPAGPLVLPDDIAPPDAQRLAAIFHALREQITRAEGDIFRFRPSGTAFLPTGTVAQAASSAGFEPALQIQPYQSVGLDLSLDETTLEQRLQGKWRTDLRFARKSDLTILHGNDEALKARFMKLFDNTQEAKGFRPTIPPEFHFPLTGSGYDIEVLIASKDGIDLAGIVVGFCAASSTYLFGATAPAGRPVRAGYLLQWAAMDRARGRGCLWHDLGGIDADLNPSVTRFKTRMNGAPILAEAWQSTPSGLIAPLILGLERLRAWLRKRGA